MFNYILLNLFLDKEVFADLDFLGWYTTGSDAPSAVDIDVYRQMSLLNECPIMLKLDPSSVRSSDKVQFSR